MSGPKVLDSWALLAYFEGQETGRLVSTLFKEAARQQQKFLISVINWGEVLYVIEMRHGTARRDQIEHLMEQMHLDIVEADKALVRWAAHLKATVKLPYADCFAAALAMTQKIPLVTGDKDFRKLEKKIHIHWL